MKKGAKKAKHHLIKHLLIILFIFLILALIANLAFGEKTGEKCTYILSYALIPTWILYTIIYLAKKYSRPAYKFNLDNINNSHKEPNIPETPQKSDYSKIKDYILSSGSVTLKELSSYFHVDSTRLDEIVSDLLNNNIIYSKYGHILCSTPNDYPETEKSINPEKKIITLSDPQYLEIFYYFFKSKRPLTTTNIQKGWSLGYAKSARIIDELEDEGLIIKTEKGYKSAIPETEIHNYIFESEDSEPFSNNEETISPNKPILLTISDVLGYVDSMTVDGAKFEEFCCLILKINGFYNVKSTRVSGDYGVDILAEKDDITYAIQCKCYSDKVGNKAVQEAYSGKSYYNCMIAAVLTNNYFTKAAEETAKANSVLLWDRNKLKEFLKAYDINTDKNNDTSKELFKSKLIEVSNAIVNTFKSNNIKCSVKNILTETNGILYELYISDISADKEIIAQKIKTAVESPDAYFCKSDDMDVTKLFIEFPESLKILYNDLMKIK